MKEELRAERKALAGRYYQFFSGRRATTTLSLSARPEKEAVEGNQRGLWVEASKGSAG